MTAARIAKLREKMGEHELDAFLVGCAVEDTFHIAGTNRRYLSGFSGSVGHLLITRDKRVHRRRLPLLRAGGARIAELHAVHQANGGMKTWLPELIGEGRPRGKKLGFEGRRHLRRALNAMRKGIDAMPESDRPQLTPTDNLVESLRVIKEPDELEALQRAVDLGDAAFEDVAARIEPGWTEKQVAWEIEKYAREHGAEGSPSRRSSRPGPGARCRTPSRATT